MPFQMVRSCRSPRQLALAFRSWGGARRGAGRKPRGPHAGASHAPRPGLDARHPLHVTLRVGRGVPSLRSQRCLGVLRRAFSAARERFGFRLVHYGVQADHIHLLCEAPDGRCLSRALQGLCIRIARRLNAELGRRGRLFADRYHARALSSPREVRNCLAYVLLQRRRHGAKRAVGITSVLDPCTSGGCFDGWSRAVGPRAGPWQETVVAAQSWLLRVGWQRHGRIDPEEVPGAPPLR